MSKYADLRTSPQYERHLKLLAVTGLGSISTLGWGKQSVYLPRQPNAFCGLAPTPTFCGPRAEGHGKKPGAARP